VPSVEATGRVLAGECDASMNLGSAPQLSQPSSLRNENRLLDGGDPKSLAPALAGVFLSSTGLANPFGQFRIGTTAEGIPLAAVGRCRQRECKPERAAQANRKRRPRDSAPHLELHVSN